MQLARSTDDILGEWRDLHARMPNTAARVNADLLFKSLSIPMPRDPNDIRDRTRRMYILRIPNDGGEYSFKIYTNNSTGRLWFEDAGAARESDFKRAFRAIVPDDLPSNFLSANDAYLGAQKMYQITQNGMPEIRALYLFLVAGYRCYGDERDGWQRELTPVPMGGGGGAAPAIGCAACGSSAIAGSCSGACGQKYCSVRCQSKDHKPGCPK